MLLALLFADPQKFVIIFGGLIIAIGLHEAAHCFMADYLGDPTPRSLGRTTLNPLAHLDPLGTLVILVTGVFGWGKPAPFDPYNLRHPQRDTALIALAGPVTNILLAILVSLLWRILPIPGSITAVFFYLVRINVSLALFNLIPVPPLDGSKVLAGVLNRNISRDFENFAGGNSLLLLFLLLLPIFGGQSIASLIISPLANILLRFLIP